MRDSKISEPRVKLLHPRISAEVQLLIEKAEEELADNMAIRIVQGFRSIEEQNALYAQGRTKAGPIVTYAKGGSSYHNYGLAFDFALLRDSDGNGTYDNLSWDIKKDNDKDGVADWLEVVKIFEAAGYFWGGKFSSLKDYPHIQKNFGYDWRQLLDKVNNKNFITGTKYVRL